MITSDVLEVQFYTAIDQDNNVLNSRWTSMDFKITNAEEYSNNVVSYRKTLTGNVSYNYPLTTIYYGDRITYTGRSGFKSNSVDYIIGGWKQRSLSMQGQSFANLLINDIAGYYDQPKQLLQSTANDGIRVGITFDYEGETFIVIGSVINCVEGTSSFTSIELGSTLFDDGVEIDEGRDNIPIGILSGGLNAIETTGLVPERRVDRSDQRQVTMEAGFENLILDISGDTTVVRVNTNQKPNITFIGFRLENEGFTGLQRLRDGQEVMVIFNSQTIPQTVKIGGSASGVEGILVAETSTAVRRARNLVATFKRIVIDGAYRWLKIFESSIPQEPEVEPPPTVSSPIFAPAGGEYLNPQTVEIINTETGADIYYTDSGGEPDTLYTGAINVADDLTLTAVAIKDGIESDDVTATYVIIGYVVNSVVFNPTGGEYTTSVSVNLSCATAGALIYYTVDGSDPDSGSLLYTSAITLTATTTVKAVAILTVSTIEYSSQIIQQTYTIDINPVEPVVDPPLFNPAEGTYTGSVQVEISCADSEATIRYTLDGSEPTSASPVYALPILISSEGENTVRAITQRSGYQDGQGQSVYTILPDGGGDAPAKPVLIPSGGQFVETKEVIIVGGSATGVQEFLFTTDGTDPTSASQLYTAPIVLTESTTIKAVARFQGQTALSEIRSGTYEKVVPSTYITGWNLISIPYNVPLTEEALDDIFNEKLSTGSTFYFATTFVPVSDNIDIPEKATRVEIGRGYWVNISEPVDIDWAHEDLIGRKYNLLTRRENYIKGSLPATWEQEITGNFNVAWGTQSWQDGQQYNRAWITPTSTGGGTMTVYLDDPVCKVYGTKTYELSMGIYLSEVLNGLITVGVDIYDKDENFLSSQSQVQTGITIGAYTLSEEFTVQVPVNQIHVLVRPWVRISHSMVIGEEMRFGIKDRFFTTPLELYQGKVEIQMDGSDTSPWLTVGSVGKELSKIRDEDGGTEKIASGTFYEFNGTYIVADIDAMEIGKGYYILFDQGNSQYEVD